MSTSLMYIMVALPASPSLSITMTKRFATRPVKAPPECSLPVEVLPETGCT